MSVEITLTPYELMLGSSVGCMRQISALKACLPDKHGAEAGGWKLHIEGALGEIAAAKALGYYWSGSINTFKDPDLSRNIQVRTRSKNEYELIVRREDRDDDFFVLVTGVSPNYLVRGWLSGRESKRSNWLATHGGRESAYFVPHQALRNMDELKAELAFQCVT